MKGILKKEQDITNKLKVELQNAQERLVDAVTKYETQIDDVKQLINMKD